MAGENKNVSINQGNQANYWGAANRRASIMDSRDNNQVVAQQAAQMFAQYGPQGQVWSKMLMDNPDQGLQMIQQSGGLDVVNRQLAYGQAQGNNATQQDMVNHVLRLEGGQAAGAYGRGQSAMNDDSGQLGVTEVLKLRKEFKDKSENYSIRKGYMQSAVKAAEAASDYVDPKRRGAADFLLINALGKMIDPNSVVRGSEADAIVAGGSDDMRTAFHKYYRMMGADGMLPAQARVALMHQIQAQWDIAAKEQQVLTDFAVEEGMRLGLNDNMLELAIDDYLNPSRTGSDYNIVTAPFENDPLTAVADAGARNERLKNPYQNHPGFLSEVPDDSWPGWRVSGDGRTRELYWGPGPNGEPMYVPEENVPDAIADIKARSAAAGRKRAQGRGGN